MQENLKDLKVIKFADDTKLYCEYIDQHSQQLIQANLERINQWLQKWKMSANTSKTGVLKFERIPQEVPLYTFNQKEIQYMKQEKVLGVLMDSRINFKTHVQSIVNKCFKIYGWMVRTLVNRDKTIVLAIYKSLIRPNLEYASSVWNPSAVGQSQILEKVQRKITKLILSKDIPYGKRLEILKLPTLKWRRMFLDMLRVYEVLHMEPELRRQLFTLNSEKSNVNLRRHR